VSRRQARRPPQTLPQGGRCREPPSCLAKVLMERTRDRVPIEACSASWSTTVRVRSASSLDALTGCWRAPSIADRLDEAGSGAD